MVIVERKRAPNKTGLLITGSQLAKLQDICNLNHAPQMFYSTLKESSFLNTQILFNYIQFEWRKRTLIFPVFLKQEFQKHCTKHIFGSIACHHKTPMCCTVFPCF